MSFLWHGLTEQGAQVPVQVDAQGRVIAVDGTPGVSNWERTGTTLSPAVPGDSVDIGSGNISLNADGSSEFTNRVQIARDSAADVCWQIEQAGTVKGFLLANGNLFLGDSTQTNSRIQLRGAAGTGYFLGDVNIGGTLPSAPNISLNADGTGRFIRYVFAGSVAPGGGGGNYIGEGEVASYGPTSNSYVFRGWDASGSSNINTSWIKADGSATFVGNVTAPNITFRSADPQFYVKKSKNKDSLPEYVGPELDLLAEIARLEALVRHLYETLRLAPPAGWPVWDGNDEVLRKLRK